jgi:hypothetical protein
MIVGATLALCLWGTRVKNQKSVSIWQEIQLAPDGGRSAGDGRQGSIKPGRRVSDNMSI